MPWLTHIPETKANHNQRYANGTLIEVGHRIEDERKPRLSRTYGTVVKVNDSGVYAQMDDYPHDEDDGQPIWRRYLASQVSRTTVRNPNNQDNSPWSPPRQRWEVRHKGDPYNSVWIPPRQRLEVEQKGYSGAFFKMENLTGTHMSKIQHTTLMKKEWVKKEEPKKEEPKEWVKKEDPGGCLKTEDLTGTHAGRMEYTSLMNKESVKKEEPKDWVKKEDPVKKEDQGTSLKRKHGETSKLTLEPLIIDYTKKKDAWPKYL